jgi:hypothetical protein
MRAAAQCRGIETSRGEHAFHAGDVLRLAAVRSAGERELLIAKTVAVGCAVLHQRQRLQHLDRRTRKYRLCHVPDRKYPVSIGIGDGNRAAVAALNQRTPHHFDENWITHV